MTCIFKTHKLIRVGLLLVLLSACLPYSGWAEIKNHPINQPAQRVKIDMITSGMLMDVADTGQRLVAVGERGHIITSEDGGHTWQQAAVPVSVTLTAVCFATPLKGWAVGFGGVILSTQDGGRTWVKQIDGSVIPAMIAKGLGPLISRLETELPATTADKKDNAARLEEMRYLRDDWQEYVDDHSCPPFMDVWFISETHGFAVGGFGLFVRTDNGGLTWRPVLEGVDNPAGHHYYGLVDANGRLFLVGEAGMAFRSADQGRSWTRMAMPYEGSYFGIIAGRQGQSLVAFGLRGNMVLSIDGGAQWRFLDQSAPGGSLSGGCITSDETIFLTGPGGGIYRLNTNGSNLTPLTQQVAGAVTLIPVKPGRLLCVGLRGVKTIDY